MEGKFLWAAGFLTAATWLALNFFLTVGLLKVALLKQSRERLFLFLIIKFPILYLLGYLILVSRIFPVSSLMLGMPATLILISIIKIWPKRI